MEKLYLFLILFLISCVSSGPLVMEKPDRPPKPWKYEDARALYESWFPDGRPIESYESMYWTDTQASCDPESSFFPFLKNGPESLYYSVLFPREAIMGNETGQVIVSYRIDTSGYPEDVKVIKSASRSLDKAVMKAVYEATYIPGFCNETAATANQVFAITFNNAGVINRVVNWN